jgi:hypothetical protein
MVSNVLDLFQLGEDLPGGPAPLDYVITVRPGVAAVPAVPAQGSTPATPAVPAVPPQMYRYSPPYAFTAISINSDNSVTFTYANGSTVTASGTIGAPEIYTAPDYMIGPASKVWIISDEQTGLDSSGNPVVERRRRRLDHVGDSVVNLNTYLQIQPDVGQAIMQAANDLPAAGGVIKFPAYLVNFTTLEEVILPAGKSYAFEGDERTGTVMNVGHAGFGIVLAQGANNRASLTLKNFTIQAAFATGVSAGAVSLSYNQLPSNQEPNLILDNFEVRSQTGAGASNAFQCAFQLTNVWGISAKNVNIIGPGLTTDPEAAGNFIPIPGFVGFQQSGCVEFSGDALRFYYVDSPFMQVGYCEGWQLTNVVAVGCGWLFNQTLNADGSAFGETFSGDVNPFNGDGFYLANSEISTAYGVFNAKALHGGLMANNHYSRYLSAGAGYTAFKLVDCFGWGYTGGKAEVPAQFGSTFASLTASGVAGQLSMLHSFHGIEINNFGTDLVLLGDMKNVTMESCEHIKGGARSSPAVSIAVSDPTNVIRWDGSQGILANYSNTVLITGQNNQALIEHDSNPGDVNHVVTLTAPEGEGPTILPGGADANQSLALAGRGTGGVAVLSPFTVVGTSQVTGLSTLAGVHATGEVQLDQPLARTTVEHVLNAGANTYQMTGAEARIIFVAQSGQVPTSMTLELPGGGFAGTGLEVPIMTDYTMALTITPGSSLAFTPPTNLTPSNPLTLTLVGTTWFLQSGTGG